EIHRVLRPGGRAIVMLYYAASFNYRFTIRVLRRSLAPALLLPGDPRGFAADGRASRDARAIRLPPTGLGTALPDRPGWVAVRQHRWTGEPVVAGLHARVGTPPVRRLQPRRDGD